MTFLNDLIDKTGDGFAARLRRNYFEKKTLQMIADTTSPSITMNIR